MKHALKIALELLIESVNFLVIDFALLYVAVSFQYHPVWILLMASSIWMMAGYQERVEKATQRKWSSRVLLILCCIVTVLLGKWLVFS